MNRKIIRWKPINSLCLFCKKIIELRKFANQLEKCSMKKVYCVVALLILMPAFKNIQGESANRLADYILANSQTSK